MKTLGSEHIRRALDLAGELIALADEGEADAEDDSCRVLFAIVRDCAYKIRAQAEPEREWHLAKGTWE